MSKLHYHWNCRYFKTTSLELSVDLGSNITLAKISSDVKILDIGTDLIENTFYNLRYAEGDVRLCIVDDNIKNTKDICKIMKMDQQEI